MDFSFAFSCVGYVGQAAMPVFLGLTIQSSVPMSRNFTSAFANYGSGAAVTSDPMNIVIINASHLNLTNTFMGTFQPVGSSHQGSGQAWIDRFLASNLTPSATTGCFSNCAGLTDYSSLPSSWK
jgi:hypothetical protein